MSSKFDFSTKEGKAAYQRCYLNLNKIQREKQRERVRRNSRNKKNYKNCISPIKYYCEIFNKVGINKKSCTDCEMYRGKCNL